jgi:hypothetical protein
MPDKGLAYNLETTRRHPLTRHNLEELGINESILDHPRLVYTDAKGVRHKPIGVSINEAVFGDVPGTAVDRGWITYMNLGEPMIEERGNIIQPPPDTLSSRVYVNRSSTPCRFEDTVEFTVANTINWSIEGSLQLTFGARAAAEIQKMIETRYNLHQQSTMHSHPNDTGSEEQQGKDETYTSQGTATGTAELSAQLMLGITASVSGSLTTSWTSQSTISGDIGPSSRVATIATQRRAVKQYSYQIPVTFAGFFAVHYPVPAPIQCVPPQEWGSPPYTTNVVARNIASDITLVQNGTFRQKGRVEVVSTLAVEHTVFEKEALAYNEQPLYRKCQVTAETART